MKRFACVLLTLSCLAPATLFADDATIETLRERLKVLVPDSEPSGLGKTDVGDLYEVRYGAQVFYMSADGRYALQGELVELDTLRNLTSASRASGRLEILKQIDESGMVSFMPEGPVNHTITVFTDVDCPYCRRLHEEVTELNERGIAVRYLMYPRAGEGSETFVKMVGIWCSDDPQKAMTEVKDGQTVEPGDCETPVQQHMSAGQMMGVNGTPSILLESGDMIAGYRSAADIADMIDHLAEMRSGTN